MPCNQFLSRALFLIVATATPIIAEAQASITPASVCGSVARSAIPRRDSVPNLAGLWDFKIDMGSAVSTGTMALGAMDDGYGGALTPDATNTVAIRKLTLKGNTVHMVVASREGDVLFDGQLKETGNEMCGVVTYHGGALFPMTAKHRPPAVRRPLSQ